MTTTHFASAMANEQRSCNFPMTSHLDTTTMAFVHQRQRISSSSSLTNIHHQPTTQTQNEKQQHEHYYNRYISSHKCRSILGERQGTFCSDDTLNSSNQQKHQVVDSYNPTSIKQKQLQQQQEQEQQQQRQTTRQHLVLIGGGHAHVQVIKALNGGDRPLDLDITVIDILESASYSGMIPGAIAGIYKPDETQISLSKLCNWASVQFIQDRVVDIDFDKKYVYIKSRTVPLPFDVISIDIGSTSRDLLTIPGAIQYTLPTRPIHKLIQILHEKLQADKEIASKQNGLGEQNVPQPMPFYHQTAPHFIVVGGGVAGIELALSITSRWKQEVDTATTCTIVCSGSELVPDLNPDSRRLVLDILQKTSIDVVYNAKAKQVTENNMVHVIQTSSSSEKIILQLPFTHCLWATGAGPHSLALTLTKFRGLDCTEEGWIQVTNTLQSTSFPYVFAAGDCSSITVNGDSDGDNDDDNDIVTNIPKAGVYAVRAGPILLENIVTHLDYLKRSNNNHFNSTSTGIHHTVEHSNTIDPQYTQLLLPKENTALNLTKFIPQDDFMKLLVCGNSKAIGFRYGLAFYGKWVFDMKDQIDRNFMKLYDTNYLGPKPISQSFLLSEQDEIKSDLDAATTGSLTTTGSTITTLRKNKLNTAQYDANFDDPSNVLDPIEAAVVLNRTDDDVNYKQAWQALRYMGRDEIYRKAVIDSYNNMCNKNNHNMLGEVKEQLLQ